MKVAGTIQSGAYQGQRYRLIHATDTSGWWKVQLRDGEFTAVREVRESVLEKALGGNV